METLSLLTTMVHISVLLGLASLAAAHELHGFTARKGAQANLLLPGANSAAVSISTICSSFEDVCDNSCIPSGATCCFTGLGEFCDAGDYCSGTHGCCPDGETCSGEPTGCSTGKELCGDSCMPTGSVCCDDGESYCDSGETCTSDGYCEFGSDGDGGSGDCYSYQDVCDGYCIPADSVCCGDGYYCDEGETCASDGTCSVSGGGDDDDEDDEPQYTLGSPSSTADSPFTVPTYSDPFEDDDDETQEEESTLCKRKGGKGGGGGGGDFGGGGGGGGGGGDEDVCASDASGNTMPAVLAGLAALLPFAL